MCNQISVKYVLTNENRAFIKSSLTSTIIGVMEDGRV